MVIVAGRPLRARSAGSRRPPGRARAGREIERDRHRRLLALVIDLQRADVGTSCVTADSGIDWPDGTPLPVTPAPAAAAPALAMLVFTKMFDSCEIGLEFGLALQDDLIVVGRRVDRRHLPGAEGVEQFLADLIDRDAVDRRLLAVDLDRHLRILDVEIDGDVAQARRCSRSCRACFGAIS